MYYSDIKLPKGDKEILIHIIKNNGNCGAISCSCCPLQESSCFENSCAEIYARAVSVYSTEYADTMFEDLL